MSDKLLSTAVVGKTHGVEGYLKLTSLSGEYNHIKKLKMCTLRLTDGREVVVEIESMKKQGDHYLVRFIDYFSPEIARRLSASVMLIDRASAPKLDEDEYYFADLIGLRVLVDDNDVGNVEFISEGAQSLYLHIKAIKDGKTYVVPNMKPFVIDIDIERGHIVLQNSLLLE